jgi:NADH-quinone oxidoreductase subunit M
MNLLVLMLLIPLFGAAVCAIGPAKQARVFALFFGLATLLVSALMAWKFFDPAAPNFDVADWNGGSLPIGFSAHLGIDGISVWLTVLTTLLTPLAIAASFGSIHDREREYYAWMLVLLTAMIGVFLAKDVLLFYVFFELTLIPMFFIIGIWGGAERRFAAAKFFLFTFAGSVFTLAAVVYVGLQAGPGHTASFAIDDVVRFAQSPSLSHQARFWVAMGLIVGFAVKVPLFPVHTWLPLAHTEAPTAGSVILAGVLLKLGTYGMLRLAVPIGLVGLMPDGSSGTAFPRLLQALALICVIGVIYGALAAWVQQDIKKLVAYSSVSHLGFCVLGLVALNSIGMQGSFLYMINHGISTGALFLMVGMIYDRYHTRQFSDFSGLARRMPILASFFVLFTLASIGLPGTNGFVSEFLTILGAFVSPHLGVGFASAAALGIILGAVYMLHMVARVFFGPLKAPDVSGHGHGGASDRAGHAEPPGDINAREISILVPLALIVIVLGVRPSIITGPIFEPVEKIRMAVVLPNPPAVTQPSILPLPTAKSTPPNIGAALAAVPDGKSTGIVGAALAAVPDVKPTGIVGAALAAVPDGKSTGVR